MNRFQQQLKQDLQDKWTVEAASRDKQRLENLGFTVVDFDFPATLIFTKQQRRNLGFFDYRPDFLCFSFFRRKVFWWEVKTRDRYDYLLDGYFLLKTTKLEKYWWWVKHYNIPLYLSLWLGKEWIGFQRLDRLQILGKLESRKYGCLEVYAKIDLTNFQEDLTKI